MHLPKDAKLLRIFLGDSDKINSSPAYEVIVREAKKAGLAGATVFKGIMGFGGTSRIHTSKILSLSEDLPLIIEIIDDVDKIDKFLPLLENLFEDANCGGLITIEKAEVIKYKADKKRK
jgi:PII-like signaling protein